MNFIIIILLFLSSLFAYNFPDTALDPVTNLGPRMFYPDSADDRLYYLPFDSGKTYTVLGPAWNRPSSYHKGYAVDWNMPTGTRVIAARSGNVNFIPPNWEANNSGVMITRVEKDSGVTKITSDFYIHIVLDTSIRLGKRVERGQLIGVVGIQNHLHLEIQVTGHIGIGKDGRTTEDVPYAIYEVRNRPDGIPWNGDRCTSRNPFRPSVSGSESIRIMSSKTEMSVWPNPFSTNLNVLINITESTNGSLTLNDVCGRTILHLFQGYISEGQSVYHLPKNNVTATGKYFLRLEPDNGHSIIKKINQF